MKKAFTITELLVAVGLLAVVLAACAVIFNYSIDSQRTANATAEIMRNLRVITDQLNADFDGFIGAPAYFRIEPNSINPEKTADSVVFLTTGDFQTSSDNAVRGNLARIYYGQAAKPDPIVSNEPNDLRNKILARRQVIITPDANLSLAAGEYEVGTLAEILNNYKNGKNSFFSSWLDRPTKISVDEPNSLRMYLVRGVDDFRIEYLERIDAGNNLIWTRPKGDFGSSALKFTFTLYDSKGIFKDGKRFEHIVYIGK